MKPIIIVAAGNIDEAGIQDLRDAGAVVVVAEEPDKVKVSDLSIDRYAATALEIVSEIIKGKPDDLYSGQRIGRWFAWLLLKEPTP